MCCHHPHDKGHDRGLEGHGHHFRRRFVSCAERIAKLEAYREDLLKEAEAVGETIQELKEAPRAHHEGDCS